MSQEVKNIFKRYCGEVGHRPRDLLNERQLREISDKRRFKMNELSEAYQEQMLNFLNKNRKKIVKDVISGSGKASAKWMLLVEEKDGSPQRSVLLPIKMVIEHCNGRASITERGNLKLGEITIQRKGGDAGKDTSQMLQFKFSPRRLFDIQGIDVIERCKKIP